MKIYLDNAATTKIDTSVQRVMNNVLEKNYGNASSTHDFGLDAKTILDQSRAIIAESIGAQDGEIIFTGSGTEANNFALKGLFFTYFPSKKHIITTAIEHDCILNTCKWLAKQGAEVTYLRVNEEGFVNIADLEAAIKPTTLVVSVIHGNNEIGTIQNIQEIGKLCKRNDVLLHVDACQSYMKVPVNVVHDAIDLMTINAHKIHGPKGVGALYIKKDISMEPILHGGGQEFGLRSSTENISGIAGFAEAVKRISTEDIEQMSSLRDWFIDEVLKVGCARLNGPIGTRRLCNNINVSFSMIEGEMIQEKMNHLGICISTSSACSSGSKKTSHVIKAIGTPMEFLHGNIRISLSKYTTKRELKIVLRALKNVVQEYDMTTI